ncbi:MAG: uncharacterized protein K0S45_572 [Nitrospira sp.]|nr:uncharacterized protein [Nitrospira sp.]
MKTERSMSVMALCVLLLGFGVDSGWAKADPAGVPWNRLSPGEQQLLQRFSDRWEQFPPRRQERLRNGARKWGTMTPEERREAKQRFKQWRTLPPEEQQQLRERFRRFRQLPPERQESLREVRRWFKSLPLEQRRELKEKWKGMTLEERQALRGTMLRQSTGQDPSNPPVSQSDR